MAAEVRPERPLQVLCSETELQEYGETIRVGQSVSRQAGRCEGAYFGGSLDEVEWGFDRYADVVGSDAAIVSGRVTAISAVFVLLQQGADGSWEPRPGSAHLEPIPSTAETRILEEEFEIRESFPDGRGGFWAAGVTKRRDGDEHLTGWLITLEDERIAPLPES